MRLPPLTPPVPFSIRWDRPPGEVAHAVAAAVQERRYVDPRGEPLPFYRLTGRVAAPSITIRATPYVLPGVRSGSSALPLEVVGEIHESGAGSELTGSITAPIPRSGLWLSAIVSIAWFVLIVPTSGVVAWIALQTFAVGLPRTATRRRAQGRARS